MSYRLISYSFWTPMIAISTSDLELTTCWPFLTPLLVQILGNLKPRDLSKHYSCSRLISSLVNKDIFNIPRKTWHSQRTEKTLSLSLLISTSFRIGPETGNMFSGHLAAHTVWRAFPNDSAVKNLSAMQEI